MSNLRIINFFSTSLLVIFSFYLSACSEEKYNRNYTISDAGRDTTIKVRDVLKGFASRHVLFKVTGMVNDSAKLFMTDATDNGETGMTYFHLLKGNNNFSDKAEAYSDVYRIVYLHKKATKGQLKIRLQLLSAAGDTLTDNE
jgi:hypothetical protein